MRRFDDRDDRDARRTRSAILPRTGYAAGLVVSALASLLPVSPASGQSAPASRPADVPSRADLSRWLRDARSTDYADRVEAVVALGELRDESAVELAVPQLVTATHDASWFVRLKAVESLRRIAPADKRVVAALAAAVNDPKLAVRAAAARATGLPEPGADDAPPAAARRNFLLPDLRANLALADDAPEHAFDAVARSAPRGTRPPGPAPDDSEAARRERVVAALLDAPESGERGGTDPLAALGPGDRWRALPALFAAFHDRTDPRGDRAARLLTRFNPEVVPVFVEALKEKGDDPVIRRRALAGLAAAGTAAAPAEAMLRIIVTGAKGEPLSDRLTALHALAPLAGGAADDGLSDFLLLLTRYKPDPLRPEIVRVLLATGRRRRDLVNPLRSALRDPADSLHADAAELLGAVGDDARSADDALFARLGSEDVAERARAAYALARINADPADADAVAGPLSAALVRAVRRNDRAVWSALAPCARRSPKAVAEVREELRDLARHGDDEGVRFAAGNVLNAIGAGKGRGEE